MWRAVKGYENMYEVSDSGEVRSVGRWVDIPASNAWGQHKRFYQSKTRKPFINSGGYKSVVLTVNSKRTTHLVHRLVACAFIDNPLNLPVVNHIDGDKLNCSVENLEWCSVQDNADHAREIGLVNHKGEKGPRAILTQLEVDEIREKYTPYLYPYSRLGDEYGVSPTTIYQIVKGNSW